MQVKKLSLANVRAFQQAEFVFQPGMNLIVGVNGAGKSTVLDVLRVMLAFLIPNVLDLPPHILNNDVLEAKDIRARADFLNAVASYDVRGQAFSQTAELSRGEEVEVGTEGAGRKKKTKYLIPSGMRITTHFTSPQPQDQFASTPLAIYFSTHRSRPARGSSRRSVPPNDLMRAYRRALEDDRELEVSEFIEWWKARSAIAKEAPALGAVTEHMRSALLTFLETYSDVRIRRNEPDGVLSPKEDILSFARREGRRKNWFDVRQLSDGERNMVALVLDITRRLSLANPTLSNPLREASAVVLIDELDLHLHPAWQRIICERLTATFPKCQFIATTHSPQIIGEVAADRITVIDNGQAVRPPQSEGMDSNWVLKYMMGVPERTSSARDALRTIEDRIEAEDYEAARSQIESVRHRYGTFPELDALNAQIDMLTFLEDDSESDDE